MWYEFLISAAKEIPKIGEERRRVVQKRVQVFVFNGEPAGHISPVSAIGTMDP